MAGTEESTLGTKGMLVVNGAVVLVILESTSSVALYSPQQIILAMVLGRDGPCYSLSLLEIVFRSSTHPAPQIPRGRC